MFNTRNATNGTPENKLEWIRKAKKELEDYGPVMTAYERLTVGEEVKRKVQEYYPAVTAHVLNKHEQAINRVKASKEAINKAQANEINRWDPATFRQNLELYGEQITRLASTPADIMRGFFPEDEIAKILTESKLSGDIFKQRAAAEIVKSLPPPADNNAKAKLANLQAQARETLQQVRETEQINQARELYNQSVMELASVRDEVIEVGRLMGGDPTGLFASGPYAQAVRRVRFHPDGVDILSPDDPKVTGVQNVEFKQE